MAKKSVVPEFMDVWDQIHAIHSIQQSLLTKGCRGDARGAAETVEHICGQPGLAWLQGLHVCDCEFVELLAADVREKRVVAARASAGCHWVSEDEVEDGTWQPGTKALAN